MSNRVYLYAVSDLPNDPAVKPLILLETAELDSMTSSDFRSAAEAHLADIRTLAAEIDALTPENAAQRLEEGGALYTLLERDAEDDPFDPVELGLGEWVDVLWATPADASQQTD